MPQQEPPMNTKEGDFNSHLLAFTTKSGMRLTTCPLKTLSISCVRDDDVLRARDGRSELTYAHGSRVCCGVCAAMVEMFFSYFVLFIFFAIGSAKVVFFALFAKIFNENDKFFLVIGVIYPGIYAPGMHTALRKSVQAHQTGDFLSHVPALQIEYAFIEAAPYPGIEFVQ